MYFRMPDLIEGGKAGAFDSGDTNEPVSIYKNFIACKRLETNTSEAHMKGAVSQDRGKPRVRIPPK
jgi:hypothetical protein